MIFKNLYWNIILRILLIVASCILWIFANNKYHDIIININIIAFIVVQVIMLIRKLNYTNRNLISFFDSLKYDDSSVIIKEDYYNQDFLRLSKRFQKVNKQILKLKEQNIKQDLYFKTVTEHATVGLLGFDNEGKVKLCNKAFKVLLNLHTLTNISQLNSINKDFEVILKNLAPSEQKLIKINSYDKIVHLTIKATEFKSKTDKLKLISVQDIKNELDQKELESWQKMVQMLRHEIMNSIGPISSTIDTINEIITKEETNEVISIEEMNKETLNDIATGLRLIKERNEGIENFIDKFRSISKLPKANFKNIEIHNLFNGIEAFWKNELENKNIQFKTEIESGVNTIYADKHLLEQVLINLIKNSSESISEKNGKIKLSAYKEKDSTILKVTDNGKGVPFEIVDKIFFPFFTTKSNGSGIGLSLSRQIIRQHGGSISVSSEQGYTSFTISL